MDLKGYLKKQGLRNLPKPLENPLDLQPEILLHPNIPRPLHQVAPRNILGNKWWAKEKKAAAASTNNHCRSCGVHKSRARARQWIEGHEIYTIDYEAGTATYEETVPLCHYCHNFIHDGRMLSLLQQNKFPAQKYAAIIQHGDRVLSQAGLARPPLNEREHQIQLLANKGVLAPWDSWRLILFGRQYPPKYKNEREWKTGHNISEEE